MSNTQTAADAIARSISHNEAVYLDASFEREEWLLVRCDDHVQNGLIHEFWGTSDDGDEWRVHIRYENEDQANAPFSEVSP